MRKLENYLLDPNNIFVSEKQKNNAIQKYKLSGYDDLAQKRVEEDISFLNFFFDTEIITQISLEMKVNTFDKLCLFGGMVNLFTGSSGITLIEFCWIFIIFVMYAFRRRFLNSDNRVMVTTSHNNGYLEPL